MTYRQDDLPWTIDGISPGKAFFERTKLKEKERKEIEKRERKKKKKENCKAMMTKRINGITV